MRWVVWLAVAPVCYVHAFSSEMDIVWDGFDEVAEPRTVKEDERAADWPNTIGVSSDLVEGPCIWISGYK